MEDFYDLADRETLPGGDRVYTIRAKEDLPEFHVAAGELGGQVSGQHNLVSNRDNRRGWIYPGSRVTGAAVVTGGATVMGESRISGPVVVTRHSNLVDVQAISPYITFSNAIVRKSHFAPLTHLEVRDLPSGEMRNAQISDASDMFRATGFGPEHVDAMLYRTTTGNTLIVGCWTGTVGTLMDEVEERRAEVWDLSTRTADQWEAEYRALTQLLTLRAQSWGAL